VILVDTAGLRETGDPVERKGVLRSRDVIARADLVLFVLDGGRAVGEGDLEAYREVAGRPHLVVVNKSDLPAVTTGEELGGPAGNRIAGVSAKTGDGLDALAAAVARELAPGEGAIRAHAPLTRERHRISVERALGALARAKGSAGEGLPLEFPAADVREASRALAELLGEVAPEEILDAVFRRFCIGK
jgi:tRNA modification GTPase